MSSNYAKKLDIYCHSGEFGIGTDVRQRREARVEQSTGIATERTDARNSPTVRRAEHHAGTLPNRSRHPAESAPGAAVLHPKERGELEQNGTP